MASVTSQLIEEVTAYAQSDSLEDAREICADGTYFPNNLRSSRRLSCLLYKLIKKPEPYFSYSVEIGFSKTFLMMLSRGILKSQKGASCINGENF